MNKVTFITGKTGQTVVTKVTYKNIVKTVVVWPNNKSEVQIYKP